MVSAQGLINVELIYDLRFVNDDEYSVVVKHQPGMEPFSYKLVMNGKLIKDEIIDRERIFTWTKLKK